MYGVMCNHEIKIIGISVTYNIYHCFVLGTFKILSAILKYVISCHPRLFYCAMEH
jgi:hypothetical protein